MLADFFEVGDEPVYGILEGLRLPWEPLLHLKKFIRGYLEQHGTRLPADLPEGVIIRGDVHIQDGAILEPGIYIAGPTVICRGAELRFGAYVRGDVWAAEKSLIGHDTEVKHSLLLPGAKAAHFAYLGDSILGRSVNLGAGTKLANVRVDMGKTSVKVKIEGQVHDSGLRKFGAILGDGVSLGCNSVTNPGTLIGKNSLAYALSSLSGYYPMGSLIKTKPNQQVVSRHQPAVQ